MIKRRNFLAAMIGMLFGRKSGPDTDKIISKLKSEGYTDFEIEENPAKGVKFIIKATK